MRNVQVRDAKASLSKLVGAAERGEPTTITRHGRPVAVLVPIADAERLYPPKEKSFVDFLMSFPGGTEFERDLTPMREVDL